MEESEKIKRLEEKVAQLELQNQALASNGSTNKPFKWRSYLHVIFLALALVSLVAGGLLVWLNRTIIDQDRYIETVGPVIEQPEVQSAISKRASEALFSQVNVEEKIGEALPPQAQFLTPAIASQVESQTKTQIQNIVASDKFHDVWIAANKRAQTRFVEIAQKGREDPVINLDDVYKNISSQLENTRIAPLLNKQLPPKIGEIQVANVPALAKIPEFTSKLSNWRWAMVLLAIAFSVLAVWVSSDRRRALVDVGWMIGLGALISFVLVRAGKGLALSKLPDSADHAAAGAVWGVFTKYLYVQIEVTLLLGLALVVGAWLLGPGRTATNIRAKSTGFMSKERSRLIAHPEKVPAILFLQRRRHYFEWAILGATLIVLLLLMPLSVGTVLMVLAVAAVALIAVEFMGVPMGSAER